MAWPPNPNKSNDNKDIRTSPQDTPPSGQEWRLLERTLMASIDEQRRARRWSIFFKLLTFTYLMFVLLMLGRGCSDTSGFSGTKSIDASLPHLAVVQVSGVIASGSPANAEDINGALIDAFEDDNAKAVALEINSPGGSPVQSDEIWQMIMDLKKEHPTKKVYAVIGDIGASGAYYIASAADEIWVNPSSLVGSIGVIMPNYNVEGLMEKAGVKDRTITAGEYKDILSMSRPITEEERRHVQGVLNNTHQNFIDAVVAGRGDKLKDPEGNKLFTGLFWTGKQSLALGLADKTGGITQLKKSLEVDTVVDYTYKDPVQALFDNLGVQMGKGLGQGIKLELTADEPKLQ